MRLAGKIAVIIGAGQSPGEGISNGRATTLGFIREGACFVPNTHFTYVAQVLTQELHLRIVDRSAAWLAGH